MQGGGGHRVCRGLSKEQRYQREQVGLHVAKMGVGGARAGRGRERRLFGGFWAVL